MGLNAGLLAVELLVLGSLALYLHARSRRYGLAPLLIFLSGLVAILNALGHQGLFVHLGGFPVEVSNVTLIPVILMTLLVLYHVDGTAVARVTILGIVGLSLLVLTIQAAREIHVLLGASPMGPAMESPSILPQWWRTTLSSIGAFVVALLGVAVVYQTAHNSWRWLPLWAVPGLALVVGVFLDDVAFRISLMGWHEFVDTFPGNLPGKIGGVLVIWPVATIYLRKIAPELAGYIGVDDRRSLDVIFGTYRQRDLALRATEEQRRRTEERLQAVVSQAPLVMFSIDTDGRFTLSEGAGLARLGLRPGQVVGDSAFELFPEVRDELRRALAGEPVSSRFTSGDVAMDVTYLPIVHEGKVVGVSGIATDVSERVRAQLALSESETRFKSTFEQAAVGLIHATPEGRITQANRTLYQLLGYSDDELRGRVMVELVHPEDRPQVEEALRDVLAGRTDRHSAEERWVRDDGDDVWTNSTVSLVRGDDGAPRYFVVVVEDITARRVTEEQLRHALKMEAVGQLTGGVAHDFNNLLTVVIGGLELALNDSPDISGERDVLEQSLQAAQKGAALTQRLLAFSRKQPLHPVLLDPVELLEGMRELLVRTLGEAITVDIVGERHTDRCIADRTQMENAILNLVINARDAMPEGGTLSIRTRRVVVATDNPHAPGVAPGAYVRISVEDQGEGIPRSVLSHVFEPFFTTKKAGKGSGLGLSMVWGFAQQSGGTVTIESEKGRGTTAHMYLPCADTAATEPAAQGS